MRYPFSPEFLDVLPEELAELFRELEAFMLGEICDRLKLADKLNEVTVQDIRVLRSHGIDLEAIKKAIAETSEVSLDKVNALLDDVAQRNQTYFDDLVSLAQVTKPQRYIDKSDVEAIRRQTLGEFKNLTQSLGFLVTQNGKRVMLEPAEAYQWALDKAETHIMSGGVSYNQAIRDAVKELADSGIQRVDYESGHTDHADVAARRAIMTGVNQLCDKYVEISAEYLETEHFEVSAHIGARDVDGPNGWENHKAWQGKVYSVRSLDKYPSIYEVCGLGDVTGLNGANCRHKRFPFVDGVSERTWTDEQLAHIDDGHGCTFEGREYTAYQATQKQRMVERTIRKLKREKMAFEKAGLKEDAQDVNVRIRRLNSLYKDFSKAANLPEQKERLRVLKESAPKKVVLSGGKAMDYEHWLRKRDRKASKAYNAIRASDDVGAISRSSGLTLEEIKTIKNHVFYKTDHILYDGIGALSADYDMAVAWKRLTEGRPEERDILLLRHELLESQMESMYNLSVAEAHKIASEKYDWENLLYELLGEEGEPDGLL